MNKLQKKINLFIPDIFNEKLAQKNKSIHTYVALAYMTGVLPIKKYSSGSALNMFDEFTFLKDRIYDEFFGFT